MTRRIRHAKVATATPSIAYTDWNAHLVDEGGHVIDMNDYGLNVKAYGAVGDGVTDDTAAIQAAIAAAGTRGAIFFPVSSLRYMVSATLVPLEGQSWCGGTGYTNSDIGPYPPVCIAATSAFNGALVSANATNSVTIRDLSFRGNNASGSIGIHVTGVSSAWLLENLFLSNFGDQAILLEVGGYSVLRNVYVQNSLLVRAGRTAHVGTIQIEQHDAHMYNVWGTASFPLTPGGYLSGWICGILVSGGNAAMTNCGGHFSEVGIALTTANGHHKLIACRGEFNQGPGYYVGLGCGASDIIGCWAFRNSQDGDGLYPGFVVTTPQNTFALNRIDGLDAAIQMSNGFDDSCDDDSGTPNSGNEYYGNRIGNVGVKGALYNITGIAQHGTAHLLGKDFVIGRGVLKIGTAQVVGSRVVDARCDDAINSGDATTDGVIDALRDAMIAHGLIAAA